MPDLDPALQEAVSDLVGDQEHLGVQVAAHLDGRPVLDVTRGHLDAARRRPVGPDSLFCCFSVTKGLAALVVGRLVRAGALDVDAPVARYWPAFRAPVTVAQALTHQGGLHAMPRPASIDFVADDRAGLDWVATSEPAWPPGEACGYHTLTFGWLARGIIEGATGRPVREVWAEVLGSHAGDMFLGLPASEEHRAAEVVERDEARGLPWLESPAGEPVDHPAAQAFPPELAMDWNDPRLRRAAQPAFAGWASARGLARRYADALHDGALVDLLSTPRVEAVDVCLELPVRRGLGMELGGRWEGDAVGALGPRGSAFGHGGHGGSVAFADPEVGLAMAVTVNLLPDPETAAERTTTICELVRGLLGVA